MNLTDLDIKFRELVIAILFVISVVTGAVGMYYSNVIQQNETRNELTQINTKLCNQGKDITIINKDVTKVKIAMVKNGLINIEDMIDLQEIRDFDFTQVNNINQSDDSSTKIARK